MIQIFIKSTRQQIRTRLKQRQNHGLKQQKKQKHVKILILLICGFLVFYAADGVLF